MVRTASHPFDSSWLQALQRRDPAAQTHLWQTVFEPLCKLCERIVKNREDAQDIVSSAVIDFTFEHAMRLSKHETVLSYLRLMVVRRALRHTDKVGRHQDLHNLEATTSAVERSGVMNQGLVECFKKLSEKAQKVMVLRFDAELTTEAIGKIVGGSKQYIGRLLTQSLEAMRNCLERRHDI